MLKHVVCDVLTFVLLENGNYGARDVVSVGDRNSSKADLPNLRAGKGVPLFLHALGNQFLIDRGKQLRLPNQHGDDKPKFENHCTALRERTWK